MGLRGHHDAPAQRRPGVGTWSQHCAVQSGGEFREGHIGTPPRPSERCLARCLLDCRGVPSSHTLLARYLLDVADIRYRAKAQLSYPPGGSSHRSRQGRWDPLFRSDDARCQANLGALPRVAVTPQRVLERTARQLFGNGLCPTATPELRMSVPTATDGCLWKVTPMGRKRRLPLRHLVAGIMFWHTSEFGQPWYEWIW